ncbi:M23 family metallopeptidase [Vibrio parahaemolyticus]|uniref:M23 family metallopeptidase n=1 Tax=Vibrio parahaemolyticus TaxID=670 RepID=UPI001F308D17|nr:M23 family metallopeptidase [Vibrio parahaemolyticus]MCG0008966.1 M23 family metallopeptidase [Vibrio parahaemolyticus]MDL2021389.1 M23 family metallopeptidase [Vibrio parahaemolyticus]MDL2025808.1 M23 family metallopeptidase [Vibrio parahaemolyticus]
MNNLLTSAFFVVCAALFTVFVHASTPDFSPPSTEETCDKAGLDDQLRGICIAYGEAHDCDLHNEFRDSESCLQLKANFKKLSGGSDISTLFPPKTELDVAPEGGQVELDEIVSVDFYSGAFDTTTRVSLSAESNSDVAELFDVTTEIFGSSIRLPYEIRIHVGASQPKLPTMVTLSVPDSFTQSLVSDVDLRVFVLNYWSDDLDGGEDGLITFEMLDYKFSPQSNIVEFEVPEWAFSDGFSEDGNFEAILTLGTTSAPASDNQAIILSDEFEMTLSDPNDADVSLNSDSILFAASTQDSQCGGESLGHPLSSGQDPNSNFGVRDDPKTGKKQMHSGTDYRVPVGTPIRAMASGRAYTNTRNPDGWGLAVMLIHTQSSGQVEGSGISVYAHLSGTNISSEGKFFNKGDIIGYSGGEVGAPGSGKSTGPHLHVEYAPNCKVFNKCIKQPVENCIGSTAGSITVSDNGSLADDAFRVSINGVGVCTTQIGLPNTCQVGNLSTGTATLTITAIIAPDNVGTYSILLGDGLTFSSGGVSRTGTLPQGGSANYSINIPQEVEPTLH